MASETDLLGQEYLHLQKVIEDFDNKALTVKAWSVTFSAAAVGLAYNYDKNAILIVSALSALAFWFVEALVKTNQQAYYRRVYELEAHFRGKESYRPFQIASAWKASFDTFGGYRYANKIMRWPHVFMPHVAVAFVATILLFAYPPEEPVKTDSASEAVTRTTRPAPRQAVRTRDASTPPR